MLLVAFVEALERLFADVAVLVGLQEDIVCAGNIDRLAVLGRDRIEDHVRIHQVVRDVAGRAGDLAHAGEKLLLSLAQGVRLCAQQVLELMLVGRELLRGNVGRELLFGKRQQFRIDEAETGHDADDLAHRLRVHDLSRFPAGILGAAQHRVLVNILDLALQQTVTIQKLAQHRRRLAKTARITHQTLHLGIDARQRRFPSLVALKQRLQIPFILLLDLRAVSDFHFFHNNSFLLCAGRSRPFKSLAALYQNIALLTIFAPVRILFLPIAKPVFHHS